jgi:hypothetical protein
MDYSFLPVTDQIKLTQQRIANVEREHYNADLDSMAGTAIDPGRLPEIEGRLDTLKAELARLEAQK